MHLIDECGHRAYLTLKAVKCLIVSTTCTGGDGGILFLTQAVQQQFLFFESSIMSNTGASKRHLLKLLKQEQLEHMIHFIHSCPQSRRSRIQSALSIACRVCHGSFVLLLLRNVALFVDAGVVDTLLFSAVRSEQDTVLEYVLSSGSLVDHLVRDCNVAAAASAAAASNHAKAARLLLLRLAADANTPLSYGMSMPLQAAAQGGHVAAMRAVCDVLSTQHPMHVPPGTVRSAGALSLNTATKILAEGRINVLHPLLEWSLTYYGESSTPAELDALRQSAAEGALLRNAPRLAEKLCALQQPDGGSTQALMRGAVDRLRLCMTARSVLPTRSPLPALGASLALLAGEMSAQEQHTLHMQVLQAGLVWPQLIATVRWLLTLPSVRAAVLTPTGMQDLELIEGQPPALRVSTPCLYEILRAALQEDDLRSNSAELVVTPQFLGGVAAGCLHRDSSDALQGVLDAVQHLQKRPHAASATSHAGALDELLLSIVPQALKTRAQHCLRVWLQHPATATLLEQGAGVIMDFFTEYNQCYMLLPLYSVIPCVLRVCAPRGLPSMLERVPWLHLLGIVAGTVWNDALEQLLRTMLAHSIVLSPLPPGTFQELAHSMHLVGDNIVGIAVDMLSRSSTQRDTDEALLRLALNGRAQMRDRLGILGLRSLEAQQASLPAEAARELLLHACSDGDVQMASYVLDRHSDADLRTGTLVYGPHPERATVPDPLHAAMLRHSPCKTMRDVEALAAVVSSHPDHSGLRCSPESALAYVQHLLGLTPDIRAAAAAAVRGMLQPRSAVCGALTSAEGCVRMLSLVYGAFGGFHTPCVQQLSLLLREVLHSARQHGLTGHAMMSAVDVNARMGSIARRVYCELVWGVQGGPFPLCSPRGHGRRHVLLRRRQCQPKKGLNRGKGV